MALVALLVPALFIVAALVVDLGMARIVDQDNDISVDQATMAGVSALSDGDARAACEAAWQYLRANESIASADIVVAPSCSALAGTCNPHTARTTAAFARGHTFTFTSPVPAGHPLMGDQPVAGADGDPCERFAVTAEERSPRFFGPNGIDLSSHAVAVTKEGGSGGSPASIILLNETRCKALNVEGSSEVRALANGAHSGAIAVDSDASGCPPSTTDTNAAITLNGNVVVRAEGPNASINSYAQGAGVAQQAYVKPAWLATDKYTVPTGVTKRHGRAMMDDLYGAAIDELHDDWASGSGMPAGFQRWTTFMATTRPFSDPCHINGGTSWDGVPRNGSPYPITVPAGNWYIDCPGGLNFQGDGNIVFRGGNVVMEAPLSLGGSTRTAFNCPSGSVRKAYVSQPAQLLPDCGTITGDSIIVVRNGGPLGTGDTNAVLWPRTFVYSPNGTLGVGLGHGDKGIYWSAPTGGPFANLVHWTERTDTIVLAGNKGIDMDGIFFAPNAPMRLEGSRHVYGTSQIFLDSLHAEGNTRFSTQPVPGRHIAQPGEDGVGLIR